MLALSIPFFSFLANPFFQMAILASMISSIIGGIVGSYVVIKRISFVTGSISHCVLSGLGFSLWLKHLYNLPGLSTLYGAIVSAVFSALIIGWITLKYKQREDSLIAAIWSVGMAIGILFLSLTPGYNSELSNFMVGNILWIDTSDILFLSLLGGISLVVISAFHKQFMAICFDPIQAKLQGVKVSTLYLLLLVLIAISIVLLSHIVGIILVITLLIIPANIAGLFVQRISRMMVLAAIIGCLLSVSGIFISYYLNTPAGASIALLSGISYLCCLLIKKKSL